MATNKVSTKLIVTYGIITKQCNMKKSISILLLCALSVLSAFAQRNYAQELIDLMQQGKCFEARDLRAQYYNYLPLNDKTYDLVYKSHMAMFFNKPDSISIYLEDLTANHELAIGPVIGTYYGKLLQMYDDTQQFEKGIKLCDRIIDYFNRNPFNLALDLVQHEIREMENAKLSFKERNIHELRRRISRDKSKNGVIKLKDSDFIRFDAMYNNIPMQTWLDTGVTFYATATRKVAEEIGVRIISDIQDGPKRINGVPVEAMIGIIDSIDFQSVKLYNIPVFIHDGYEPQSSDTLNSEAKSKIEVARNERQIIIGLPAMKMIGKIEFDWEKGTVCFPENAEETATNNSSNIFINDNYLYQRLEINGLDYVGYVDTGDSDFINMSFSFYEKNKSHIEIDSTIEKKPINHYRATGIFLNIPYEIVKNPRVYSNGKNINPDISKVLVLDETLPHLNLFDGIIGADFFKRLGSKVIFDFDNMEIKAKD